LHEFLSNSTTKVVNGGFGRGLFFELSFAQLNLSGLTQLAQMAGVGRPAIDSPERKMLG